MVTGSEWFTHAPNNAAVMLLVQALGPMPGSYRGPYPTREEAFAALRKPQGRVPPGGAWTAKTFGLPGESPLGWLADDPGGRREIRYAAFQGSTVILGTLRRAFLVDRSTGVMYARYLRGPGELVGPGGVGELVRELGEEIRLEPWNPELYRERAEILLGEKDEDGAYADFVRALEVAPPDWGLRPQVESRRDSLSH